MGEDSDQERSSRRSKAGEDRGGQALARRGDRITSQLTLPLIGDKSIEDFAALTKETLDFTKAYASVALASALVICCLALLL